MKVKVNVLIDEGVWELFKDYVYNKYRRLYGALGRELEAAILQYVSGFSPSPSPRPMDPSAPRGTPDDTDGRPRGNQRLLQELEAIVSEIAKDFEVGGQIPLNVLKRKILNVVGPCSENKINNRIGLLQSFGVIESDPDFPGSRVYTVRKLSLWTGGTHGGPDPAGGLRGERWGAHRLQV
jgi:hypothetical protein